jgi:hypothetical protein
LPKIRALIIMNPLIIIFPSFQTLILKIIDINFGIMIEIFIMMLIHSYINIHTFSTFIIEAIKQTC